MKLSYFVIKLSLNLSRSKLTCYLLKLKLMKLSNFFMNSALDEIQCLLSSVKTFMKTRSSREYVLFGVYFDLNKCVKK